MKEHTLNHLCSDNVDRVYLETLELVCKTLSISIEELIEIDLAAHRRKAAAVSLIHSFS
ncbi:helix-turn-helix transcriptional regulator [Paenibacillus lautus]|uniref:helix-turn-helix domain-containing protein n=1 Tax=Paenibacillus lautus TaxID=1401 RepID=UPI003D27D38C